MEKIKGQFRQGDVLVKEIKMVPENLQKRDNCILAYGEVSGHKHQVLEHGELYDSSDGRTFLIMKEEGTLTHEEHKSHKLKKGLYEVVIQREVDLVGKVRQVMD